MAELGHDVLCVDVNEERVRLLKDGRSPIHEPGLEELVRRSQRAGRLRFGTRVDAPHDRAAVYIVAVGAPIGADGGIDLDPVYRAVDAVAEVAKSDAVIAMKTTVPVGTCDVLVERLASQARVRLDVVHNPEFFKEGAAVEDFFRPDRVVIGAADDRAGQLVRSLYAPLQLSGQRILMVDRRSAELAKLAANAMLAVRVSFMNEMAQLCAATGADIHAVRLAVGSDARIGRRFLYAGPGYGGSCLPKDVQAIAQLGRQHDVPIRLAEAAQAVNGAQLDFVVGLVEQAVGDLRGKTVALWGLAFKPETDDVRSAPSVALARILIERGARIVGHDPEAGPNFLRAMGPPRASGGAVAVVAHEYEALESAHVLVLMTEWRSYLGARFDEIARCMRRAAGEHPPVVDARNVWNPAEAIAAGLRYRGIGVRVPG